MFDIQKPSFKDKTIPFLIKDIVRYMGQLVDQLNRKFRAVENKQTLQQKQIDEAVVELDRADKKTNNAGTFFIKLRKSGKSVHLFVTGTRSPNGTVSRGREEFFLPTEFRSSFFTEAVELGKNESLTFILENNKIAIDYDFGENNEKIALYTSYII